jgi:hypothetical protein
MNYVSISQSQFCNPVSLCCTPSRYVSVTLASVATNKMEPVDTSQLGLNQLTIHFVGWRTGRCHSRLQTGTPLSQAGNRMTTGLFIPLEHKSALCTEESHTFSKTVQHIRNTWSFKLQFKFCLLLSNCTHKQ